MMELQSGIHILHGKTVKKTACGIHFSMMDSTPKEILRRNVNWILSQIEV